MVACCWHNSFGIMSLTQQLWWLVAGTKAAMACCWHNSCGGFLLAQQL
jgi:hypothetical protein